MSRARRQIPADAGEDYRPPSRSQKKRDSSALQALGESLARRPKSARDKLPLTEDLQEAFDELDHLTQNEARRRQLQYIGRLMREALERGEVDELLALEGLNKPQK